MNLSVDNYGLLPLFEVEDQVHLTGFNSTSPSLNSFLVEEAPEFQRRLIGNTTCVFHVDSEKLVAYYTLSNTGIQVSASELMDLDVNTSLPLTTIPAVLIGKFALDRDFAGCGNGRNIINLAIGSIINQENVSATRLIVVDSVFEAVGFYEACGFVKSLEHERRGRNHNAQTVKMYRDILQG